ncbi:hypothetical protein A5657_07135 [Mycobacterium kubicae]|nr:hypothetical protein A5657_07135 [Mycobacterium kubicae]
MYIVAESVAHISPYWASKAASAAVFWPSTLVDSSCARLTRLAAITGGGTIAASAVSKAVTADMA